MPIRIYPLLLALSVLPLHAWADSYESHDRIREAARQHVLEWAQQLPGKVEVTTGSLDRRLRLSTCDIPLTSHDSPNGLKPGRSVVAVRCEGKKPWKIYVSVNIATLQPVVVAARTIARGHLLDAHDARIEMRDTSRMHKAYYTDLKGLSGLKTRRQITAGSILDPSKLQRRQLVKRGSTVQILASEGPLQVHMKGKALDNGARGERIRVRNLSSGREITGEVIASGVIQVAP